MIPWPITPVARVFPEVRCDYEVVYHEDFRRFPTTTNFSDGSNVIGARAWSAGNTGNSDTFKLVASLGVQIAPKANTEYTHTTQSAPFLQIPLTSLVPRFRGTDRLFVQVRLASSGLSGAYQHYGIQVGSGASGDKSNVCQLGTLHDGTGLQVRTTRLNALTASSDVAVGAEPRYLGLRYQHGVAMSRYVTAPDWPAVPDMTIASYSLGIGALDPSTTEGTFAAGTDLLRLWCARHGASDPGAFTATFEALRVLRVSL